MIFLSLGLRCDHCNFGYKLLHTLKNDGCEPCQCNIHGSVNNFCNPSTGQCNCKENIKGLHCDACIDGFYGLDAFGCKPCDCQMAGSVFGTACDHYTGQCICKPNFGERRCSDCLDGYYQVQQNDSLACLPCNCDKAGTVNGSSLCDKSTGQCPCKASVAGLRCSQCMPHTYNLTTQNFLGCEICDCDPLGTGPGTVCDQLNGQCVCLPHHHGRRCNVCKPGKEMRTKPA